MALDATVVRREWRIVSRIVALASLVLLTTLGSARAQVACTSADVLCTGDPCVIPALTLASPCAVDFGPRTLVIGGTLTLPEDARLDLTAGGIEIRGTIDGGGDLGADVGLTATAGAIRQFQRIAVSGRVASGSITLVASGDIDIGSLQASAGSRGATAGSVLVDAGGVVTLGGASRIGVQGGRETPAGTAIVRGAAGADLAGHLEIGGSEGATVELSSSHGPLFMGTDVRGSGTAGAGGTMVVRAGTTLDLGRTIVMDGRTAGGSITVSAPHVTLRNQLRASGKAGAGGTLHVTGGTLDVQKNLQATGATTGGRIVLAGDAVTLGTSSVDVRGRSGGGEVVVAAATGDVVLGRRFTLSPGGKLQASAAGNLTLIGRFQVGAGGCVGLAADGVVDVAGAMVDAPISASCGLVP